MTGRITNESGAPLVSANVVLEELNLGTLTNEDGRYLVVVPASRVSGQEITLAVSLIGYASQSQIVTLQAGTVQQDFTLVSDPLLLDQVVVTGQGMSTERLKLGTTISSVQGEELEQSQEPNLVAALAAKAPGVRVTSSAGDPGAGAYIRIRGAKSLLGDGQPLFVVDGVPINNSTDLIESNSGGTAESNRAMDINPNDIASIQILKGAAASAIYGSRAANGVVLVTTKSGRPGQNRVTYNVSYGIDQVTHVVPLQRRFGQGAYGAVTPFAAAADGEGDICALLYGAKDACGMSWDNTPIEGAAFNHAEDIFKTGSRLEHFLTWSGGSDRTTYYLSLGRLDHTGVIDGNSSYERNTVRLKGSHAFTDDLRLSGNFAYTDSHQLMVQQGSNISGLLLGSLRTPPDFNNEDYLTEGGLHRSYRNQNPSTLTEGRGYDNPFWIAREMPNTSDVGRTIGNIGLDYTPTSWLNFSYTLGADYYADERLSVWPKSSSSFPDGQIIRADFVAFQVDHNLLATATHQFSDDIAGSLTLGQNLNHREYNQFLVNGQKLIYGTDQLDFTVNRIPDEDEYTIRTDGYFAQAGVDLFNELFLTGSLRLDGSSTFGGEGKRFVYPKASLAWDFTNHVADMLPVSFAKLRGAWGIAGKQPAVYSNVTGLTTGTFSDGWLSPNGLESIYQGNEGILSPGTLGNDDIAPERTMEYEAGVDLAFLDSRLAFGVTFYQNITTDAILQIDVPTSTGYFSKWDNAGEFENHGWELTLDARPVETENVSWSIGANWAKNESCVRNLAGAQQFGLAGFVGAVASVIAPDRNAAGDIEKCYPFGVFYGSDFVRFGRGSSVVEGGAQVAIDEAYSDWNAGDLYIGSDGLPLLDPQTRVIGNPNPDWTAALRSTVTIFENLRISGLLDIKYGGDVWNGTKGALYYFGTHKDTEPYHGDGKTEVIGETYYADQGAAGPGAGQEVNLNWWNWFTGIGSGFTGPSSQNIEDGGFVKLRDISVSYRIDDATWLDNLGFSSIDLTVSGRNLKTWTDYTGIDPESNLWGQDLGRGIDYFNNPQTRSFLFDVTITR